MITPLQALQALQALRGLSQPIDWDAVYNAELPRVYNYFLYRTGSRENAQDLTATTFERAWKTRSRYDAARAAPATWLLGIARNVFREELRRSPAAESLPAEENLPADIDLESDLLERQDKERLRTLLGRLSPREQELIALKYGAELTNREIARLTRLSESNVGSILHRVVTHLRKKWDENHER